MVTVDSRWIGLDAVQFMFPPRVTFVGNIQPARLRAYLSDTLASAPSDDRLFQRFQILVWPDTSRSWKLTERPPNAGALATTEKVFSILANISSENPLHLRFGGDSQVLFYEWLYELEYRIRGESLPPILVSHFSEKEA